MVEGQTPETEEGERASACDSQLDGYGARGQSGGRGKP